MLAPVVPRGAVVTPLEPPVPPVPPGAMVLVLPDWLMVAACDMICGEELTPHREGLHRLNELLIP